LNGGLLKIKAPIVPPDHSMKSGETRCLLPVSLYQKLGSDRKVITKSEVIAKRPPLISFRNTISATLLKPWGGGVGGGGGKSNGWNLARGNTDLRGREFVHDPAKF